MKILIEENEKIYVDGNEITSEKINSAFLEDVIAKGLDNEVDFEIKADENLPIAKLFKDIKEMVQPNSEFYKKIVEIRENKEKLEESIITESDKDLLTIDDFIESNFNS